MRSTQRVPAVGNYVYDDVKPGDEAFIFNSWILSYRQSPEGSTMPMNDYSLRQHKRIEVLLARAVFVMLRPDDWADGIIGYACAENRRDTNVFHYAFIKSGYRRDAMGWGLLDEVRRRAFKPSEHRPVFTHLREPYTKALERRGFRFNPFYIE